LHENHIAHRDLKCENILLDKGFHVRIGDFGFARLYLPGEEKSRTFCGSLSYAPPEVIHGDPYNPLLGDLWSIGIVLFIMLNKSMPFDDSGTRKMYESQMNRTWKFRHKVFNQPDYVFEIIQALKLRNHNNAILADRR